MTTFPVILLLMSVSGVFSAKILLLPGPGTSHCLEMMSIAEELLKRGHHVTLYSMLIDPAHCTQKVNTEQFKSQFKMAIPKTDPSFQKEHEKMMAQVSDAFFQRQNVFMLVTKIFTPMIQSDCNAAFHDMKLLEELRKDKYDIALVEGIPFMGCFFAIPIFLDIPVAAVGSVLDPQDCRLPLQTNTFPSFMTEYSNEMSFHQRVVNTLLAIIHPIFRYLVVPSVNLAQYSEKLAEYNSRDLVKNSVLFLENSDYIVDYPKALFPNFVQVGALTANPAKPLPDDFKKLLDGAKGGTVLVTFGSMLKDLPNNLQEKLMSAFGRLKQQVLFKQDKNEVRGNVRIMKWLPQNDILGHPNTKLFISHCGKNGFWESLYHGVPIICMQVHAETYITKVKVMKYGIGSSINIFDDSVDELVETINGVLGNDNIRKNMKKMSTLLRDRPETPRQRAASAIEHVIKYGGDHMKPPSVDFGFLAYTNIDVWVTLFVFDLVVIWFVTWIIRKCCCKRKSGKSKTE